MPTTTQSERGGEGVSHRRLLTAAPAVKRAQVEGLWLPVARLNSSTITHHQESLFLEYYTPCLCKHKI